MSTVANDRGAYIFKLFVRFLCAVSVDTKNTAENIIKIFWGVLTFSSVLFSRIYANLNEKGRRAVDAWYTVSEPANKFNTLVRWPLCLSFYFWKHDLLLAEIFLCFSLKKLRGHARDNENNRSGCTCFCFRFPKFSILASSCNISDQAITGCESISYANNEESGF